MSLLEPGFRLIQETILSIGYPGLAFLMALDATIIPVPSAAVMGFAGYLCYLDRMDLAMVTLFGALGSMLGSILMYGIARWGGRPLMNRYGRLFGLNERRMRSTERWFQRHGSYAVFLSQLLPIFRDLIPFPAGLAQMNAFRFSAFSFLGSLPFCLLLAMVGLFSGPAWEPTIEALDEYDIWIFVGAAAAFLAYLIYWRWHRKEAEIS